MTHHTFVHAVPPPSRQVPKPGKLAKVQAKPLKPPAARKPGRGVPASPGAFPQPAESQPWPSSVHLPSPPEPKVLNSGLAKKLAVGSMQTLFPTTGEACGGLCSPVGGQRNHTGPPAPKCPVLGLMPGSLETPWGSWVHFHFSRGPTDSAGSRGWMWGGGDGMDEGQPRDPCT